MVVEQNVRLADLVILISEGDIVNGVSGRLG